jgi:hypothetical protein
MPMLILILSNLTINFFDKIFTEKDTENEKEAFIDHFYGQMSELNKKRISKNDEGLQELQSKEGKLD